MRFDLLVHFGVFAGSKTVNLRPWPWPPEKIWLLQHRKPFPAKGVQNQAVRRLMKSYLVKHDTH